MISPISNSFFPAIHITTGRLYLKFFHPLSRFVSMNSTWGDDAPGRTHVVYARVSGMYFTAISGIAHLPYSIDSQKRSHVNSGTRYEVYRMRCAGAQSSRISRLLACAGGCAIDPRFKCKPLEQID